MKKILFIVVVLANILISSCNNQPTPKSISPSSEEEMHREHTLLRDNLAHKEIIILDNPFTTPQDFNQTFETFYTSYLSLEDALVKSDTVAANKAAEEMKNILELIPEPNWEKQAKEAWENHRKGYEKNLKEFLHIKSLEDKRSYFSHITEILYCTFKSFDTKLDEVHVAFCPMAFDNKGAYWLTDRPEIRNPYFGDKMLKCGKIEEVIPKGNL